MNANTARLINEAIDQGIRCGESTEALLAEVRNALVRALVEDLERRKGELDEARLRPF